MSFLRYPVYKDSGVEWLGEVPADWKISSLKRQAKLLTEKSDRRNNPIGLENVESWSGRQLTTETEFQGDGVAFERGDILFGKLRPYLAKVLLARESGEAVGDFHVLRPSSELISSFLAHAIRNREFIAIVDGSTYGAKMPRASWEYMGSMPVAVPPISEQTAIAGFLDRETAKIDALVAEQQNLIALLKEKRQALISHAVTKGLDPDVPMKDSGVAWLGEVPAHWEIRPIKAYFGTCSGGTPNTSQQELYYADEVNGVPWVRTTDLNNDVLFSAEVFITEQALEDTACAVLPPGTVMVAMYGGDGTVGKNGLLGISAAINQAICGLLPCPTHVPEFAFRFIQFCRPYWMIGAESSRKDPNISQERVRNSPFVKPPLEEQEMIVQFLDSELRAFNELTLEAERSIDLLYERRTALISAAVTGKIDVRRLAVASAEPTPEPA